MNFLGLNSYASDEELENDDQVGQKRKSVSSASSKIIIQDEVKPDEDNREVIITVNIKEETAIETAQPSNSNITENFHEEKETVSELPDIPAVILQESEGNFYTRLKELPLPSNKPPNPKTVEKIGEYLDLKELSGFNLTEIDEIGSNYPQSLFDPHGYQEIDFEANIKKRYSNISTSIKVNSITSNVQQKPRIAVPNTQKPPVSGGQIKPTTAIEAPKKKSRWDSSNSLEVLAKSVTEASLTSRSSTSALK